MPAIIDWIAVHVPDISGLHDYYASNLRTSIFTGFFTLSGFLLSMKAFIVVNLKKDVYDSKAYKNHIAEMRSVNPELSNYGPLHRLSTLLFWTIVCALSTSTLQLTLGLWKQDLAALICIAMAIATLCVVFVVLFVIGSVIRNWIRFSEYEAREENKKQT